MATQILQKMVARDSIPHALLFVGDATKVKEAALDCATVLVAGTKGAYHPDLHECFPEGKTGMHTVKSLKTMLQEVNLTAYKGGRKVFIIYESERMLPSSSNMLLKTVEEPPPRTHFLLLTSHKEKLLPTLLSRCHLLYFGEANAHITALQHEFFLCLTEDKPLTSVIKLVEESRSAFEKNLPDEEEREALITLHYQERVRELFALFYLWGRDSLALSLGFSGQPLLFSKKCALPLSQIEQRLKEAELGLERGINLKTLLEYLTL